MASIVNARDDFGADPRRTFGQFLASFRIAHPVPEGIGLRELVHDVHAETTRIKRHKLYLQTIVALGLSSLMWRFLSVPRRQRFFAKHYPAWGGVTALNVDALWAMSGADAVQPPDYIRAVSTGPLCPLVLAVTTARDTLHIGVSFRTAAFSRATMDSVIAGFERCIESSGGGRSLRSLSAVLADRCSRSPLPGARRAPSAARADPDAGPAAARGPAVVRDGPGARGTDPRARSHAGQR